MLFALTSRTYAVVTVTTALDTISPPPHTPHEVGPVLGDKTGQAACEAFAKS
jgi:hypothetical protein